MLSDRRGREYVRSLWVTVVAAVGLVLGLVVAPAATASSTADAAGGGVSAAAAAGANDTATSGAAAVDPVDYINAQNTGTVIQVSASTGSAGAHTCAVTTGNTVYCWGNNEYGRLGNDSTTQSEVPVAVVNGTDGFVNGQVESVSAGEFHTCAVTTGNTVYCWGRNSSGQLGNDSEGDSPVPVPVADSADGGFVNGSVESVSAGGSHTCAVTTGNTVYCWGSNSQGQLGTGSTTPLSLVPVAVVNGDEGFVNGQVESVSAGYDHTCAVTTGITVYCWGNNFFGQLGNGTSENDSSVPVRVLSGELTVDPDFLDFGLVPAGGSEVKNDVTIESTFAERVVVVSDLKTGDRSFFGWKMCSVTDGTVAFFDKSGECTGVASFAAPKGAEPGEYAVETVVTPHVNKGTIEEPDKGAALSGGLDFTMSAFVPAGMDAGPVVSADKNPVSFGTVEVGDVKEKNLTITNVGDEPLDIDRVKVVDSDDEFDAVDTGQCLKGKIQPDKSCRMTVRFFPRDDGPAAGVLQIKSNSQRGTDQVGLNGNGELVIVPDADGDLDPPGKVRKLKAASKSLSCRAATVSWKEPKDSGSAPVTSYDVRIKKSGDWKKWKSTDWVPNANDKITKRYKKLTPKKTYKVQVRAVSAVGAGEKKTVKFTTPRCGVPTKPGNG